MKLSLVILALSLISGVAFGFNDVNNPPNAPTKESHNDGVIPTDAPSEYTEGNAPAIGGATIPLRTCKSVDTPLTPWERTRAQLSSEAAQIEGQGSVPAAPQTGDAPATN
jgi:hypothetical protein